MIECELQVAGPWWQRVQGGLDRLSGYGQGDIPCRSSISAPPCSSLLPPVVTGSLLVQDSVFGRAAVRFFLREKPKAALFVFLQRYCVFFF